MWFRSERERAEHFLRGGGAELVDYQESRDGVKVVVRYAGLVASGFGLTMPAAVSEVSHELVEASRRRRAS